VAVLVGGLMSRSISLLRMGADTGFLVEEARLLAPLRTRIRDVREGPDGLVYVLTDEEQGQLLRLVPPGGSGAGGAE
jgi:glucose/arabinose dehydrogenase